MTQVANAARQLIHEAFNINHEIWVSERYGYEAYPDRISVFCMNTYDESILDITFAVNQATIYGGYSGSTRFDYADPNFDYNVIVDVKKRLRAYENRNPR